jgi:hypothetical protein
MLIASIFLNLWESICSIIGDPSRKADKFQSKYLTLGFTRDFKEKNIICSWWCRNCTSLSSGKMDEGKWL